MLTDNIYGTFRGRDQATSRLSPRLMSSWWRNTTASRGKSAIPYGSAQDMKKRLSHYSENTGEVSMVDVSAKQITERRATAAAYVAMSPQVIKALPQNKKGNPLEVARIAGISGAKKTADLIPLCHQLPLTHVSVDFDSQERRHCYPSNGRDRCAHRS